VMMKINSLDQSIGLETYASKNEGIGGRLRLTLDDFVVEEKLCDKSTKNIHKKIEGQYQYPVLTLKKTGLDTFNALRCVEKELKCKMHYLGLKDAKATTIQHVSPTRKMSVHPNRFEIGSNIIVGLYGYTSRPLTRRDLLGNDFSITVSNISSDRNVVGETLFDVKRLLKEMKIPNFFGYQRFGSSRPISHLIGREIIKQRFDEAIRLLLTYSSTADNLRIRRSRSMCETPSGYSEALMELGRRCSSERSVIEFLLLQPENYVGALRTIPLSLRRLFVHAYQSYLFNRILSLALIEGLDISSIDVGDMYALIDLREGQFIRISRLDHKIETRFPIISVLLLPLIGYAYRSQHGRLDRLIKRVLSEEDVSPRAFYVREMSELSVEGSFRSVPILSNGFSWSSQSADSIKINTFLYKGSYATILLREIMKPSDPRVSCF
jgi:tRNA pseudouridine13 synthase